MDVRTALTKLTSENEDIARTAFDCLDKYSRPALLQHLRRRFTPYNPDNCEEAIQAAFSKVWRGRARFRGLGIPAWHKYIQIAAVRCYLDLIAQRLRQNPPLSIEDVPEAEIPPIWDIYEALLDRGMTRKILQAADTLWLGIPAEMSLEQRTRQVLAAKWFYLEGIPLREVIDLLGPPLPGEPALTDAILDAWLSNEGILRALLYEELYYTNDRLTWHLLGQTGPARTDKLDALCRDMSLGLVSPETAVILWHYRCGLPPDEIADRITPSLEQTQVQEMLDSLETRLPFKSQMQHLLECLTPLPGVKTRALVCEAGLWQRLAFQYRYADELGQRDVRKRLQPCAEVAEYYLTPAMLNIWLSGKRLSDRLVRYYIGQLHRTEEGAQR